MDPARVSVQFQSVTERLSPHDTILAFSKSSELQDSNLSSACSLHTATASIKSSSDSLPQRNLAEITEDASEYRVEDKKERRGAVDFERGSLPRQASGDSQTRSEKVNGVTSGDQTLSRSTSVNTQRSPRRPRTTSNIDKALPPTPGEIECLKSQTNAPGSVLEYGDYKTRPSVEGRKSSQSARPSPRDLYDASGYKQKVKYGPRPSIESVGRSDNMDGSNQFRPVSTLPAGLRMPTRKVAPPSQPGQGQARPQSQQTQRAFPGNLSSQETLRAAPVTPIQIPDRNCSVVMNGLLTPAKTPAEAKSPKFTPEKRRLMKALQLRQKQLAAQQAANDLQTEEAPAEPQYTKFGVDDSILNAIVDTSNTEVDSNLVHVAVKDLSKEESRNVEASPISLPETPEGPSTQASSITDGEDIAAQKEQEKNATEQSVLPGNDGIRPDNLGEDTLCRSIMAPRSAAGLDDHEVNQPIKDSAPKELPNTAKTHEPPQLALSGVYEALIGQGNTQETQYTATTDGSQGAAAITPLNSRKEPPIENIEAQGTAPRPSSLETSPAAANSLSLLEEQNISTRPTDGERLVQETKQAKVSEITSMQHLVTPHAEPNHNGEEAPQKAPLEISAPPFEVMLPGSDAAATDRGAEGQLDAILPRHDVSHQAVITPIEYVVPQEVPLRPTGEDGGMILNSHRASVQSQSVSQQPDAEDQRHSRMLQAQVGDVEATRPLTSDIDSRQQGDRQMPRPSVFNTPERLSSPEHSDEHFLSDDSFMEELKYAKVQEAKPISVSRSPIKPSFSRSESEQRLVDTITPCRSVSSPLNPPSKDEVSFSTRPPNSSSIRSVSASQSLRPENQHVPPMPKKIGVSSGISQRIKALEQLSSRPTSPQSGAPAPSNTSQFVTLRKISVRTPPGASDPSNNLHSKSRPTAGYPSPSPSPEAVVKSNSFVNLAKPNYSRPESVSVTATIVRDARTKSPEIPVNVSEPRAMELHQSPLVVEHQKMAPPPLSPLKPPRPRYARYASARSGSTSSTEQRLDVLQTARRDSFVSMRSKSSRASEVEMPPRSLSDSSLISGLSSLDDIKEEKKDSKRSRLMKRMSSISIMSRRSIAHALSPSPKEIPIMERQEPTVEAPSTAIDVGDVNVQFPDTLVGSSSTFLRFGLICALALEATAYGRR